MSSSSKNLLLPAIGWILSVYALYVEHKMHHLQEEEEFSALCDIEAIGASCSTVFSLPVGKMLSYFGLVPVGSLLDIPNAGLGVIYYSLVLFVFFLLEQNLDLVPYYSSIRVLLQLVATLAWSSSIFLAYQLTFVLGDLCILCWSTHVINTYLFYVIVVASSSRQKPAKGREKTN